MTMMQSSSQEATSQIFFEVEVEAPQEGLVSAISCGRPPNIQSTIGIPGEESNANDTAIIQSTQKKST